VTSSPPSSVAAPTQPTLTTQSRAQLDRLRADVGTFEIVLQRAIDRAVLQTSQWAQQVVPDVVMSSAEPVVHGVPVGDASITFSVEVGGMVGVEMWQLMHQRLQPQPPQPQPDPNVQRVGAQIVQADSSAGPPPRVTSNSADVQYSEYVRQAMIDAILDNSGVLQLKDEQTLAVAVIPTSVSGSGPYRKSSATLILSIKGVDLEQLRQGKISRDEAKRRIVETHF
ncbi:MAG TPA: hypothetical protein VIX35_08255, partial [Vicinamibacterales bacterium]